MKINTSYIKSKNIFDKALYINNNVVKVNKIYKKEKNFEIVENLNNKYDIRIHNGYLITKEYKNLNNRRMEIMKNYLIANNFYYSYMELNKAVKISL